MKREKAAYERGKKEFTEKKKLRDKELAEMKATHKKRGGCVGEGDGRYGVWREGRHGQAR